MRTQATRRVFAALLIAALAALGFAGDRAGETDRRLHQKFAQCPYKNLEVKKCIYSVDQIRRSRARLEESADRQPGRPAGWLRETGEEGVLDILRRHQWCARSPKPPSRFRAAWRGSSTAKKSKILFLRISCEVTFENGVTGLFSTLELARPASEIRISENNLAGEAGVALKLPVKVHLENPFLGSGCYVGLEARRSLGTDHG